MQAIINLYETFSEALHTIQELEAVAIQPETISLIIKNGKPKSLSIELEAARKKTKGKKTAKGAAEASSVPRTKPGPAVIDKDLKAKFFERLNVSELAGIGSVVGAGWLLREAIARTPKEDAGLISTTPFGLITSLTEHGLTQEHAETYVEGMKRGATLIGVVPHETAVRSIRRVMQEEHRPLDAHMRGHHYWTRTTEYKEESNTASNRMLSVLISMVR